MKSKLFEKEKKKERMKLLKGSNKQMKIPKDVKNVVLTAGGIILLAEAVDILN